MGWFSKLFKKIVAPIVEPIVKLVTPIVEPVIKVLAPVVTAVVKPIVDAVAEPIVKIGESIFKGIDSKLVQPILDAVDSAVTGAFDFVSKSVNAIATGVIEAAIKLAPTVAFELISYLVDKKFDPKWVNVDDFKPVKGAVLVQHETVSVNKWTADEIDMVRDVTALTQAGFADLSDLSALPVKPVDAKGYITNTSAFFASVNWHSGIERWVQEKFDFIRVQEATISPLFEANVSLLREKATGEYTITIGGTASISDIVTDAVLTFAGTTPGTKAIAKIIADFFKNDIVGGKDAHVNLMGTSLGGAEARLQYQAAPDLFDKVFLMLSAGIGGIAGTHYDRNMWKGVGDAKITEVNGNEAGTDANDFVTALGHIGAGKTYFIDDLARSSEHAANPFSDPHLNHNFWASIPGGEYPTTSTVDAFIFG